MSGDPRFTAASVRLAGMTRDERSLLVYLETCLVDQRGYLDGRRMNAEDLAILNRWNADGFVRSGRLKIAVFERRRAKYGVHQTHWVEFTEAAWALAHEERRARSWRMIQEREEVPAEDFVSYPSAKAEVTQ